MKDNELIAEFMGVVETEGFYDSYGTQMPHYYTAFGNYRTRSYTGKGESLGEFFSEARYHESWDWLMPVVQKIDSMMPEIKMPRDLESMKAGTHGSEKYIDVLSLPLSTPISEAYSEIVKFIKWYKSVQQ